MLATEGTYPQPPDRLPGVPAHDDVSPDWDDPAVAPAVAGAAPSGGDDASSAADEPPTDVEHAPGRGDRDREEASDVPRTDEVCLDEVCLDEAQAQTDRTGPDHALTDRTSRGAASGGEEASTFHEGCTNEDDLGARAEGRNLPATPRHPHLPPPGAGRKDPLSRPLDRRVWPPPEDVPPPF